MGLHKALEIDFHVIHLFQNLYIIAKYRLNYITILVKQFRICLKEIMPWMSMNTESCYVKVSKVESDLKAVLQSNNCTIKNK